MIYTQKINGSQTLKKGLLWGLCLAILLPTLALAAEVPGLYEAEAQVFSQKRSERAAAMVVALAEVLVKVSGQRDAALQKGVAKAIRRPARFLQQYQYRALSAELREQRLKEALLSGSVGGEPQNVYFRFDKAAVDTVLRNNNLPVWGATRPATLVWLAVEDESQRYLLSSGALQATESLLKQEAQRRGLALLLPLMDLQDQRNLTFADVWGGFKTPIMQASARYHAESILVGRMSRTVDNEWQAQWTLIENAQAQSWSAEGVLATEVIDEGVAGAVELLAARYAPVVGAQAGLLPMTVMEVRSLQDYARVSRYLQSLQQVKQVQVAQVDGDQVLFELDVEGSPEAVAQTIALGSILRRQQDTERADAELPAWLNRNKQIYQLIP
jgi:uncharacterized protein